MGCPCTNNPNLPQYQPCSQPCNNDCEPCVSNMKICHFVVDTLEEAKQFRNSYVVVTSENNAVYHIGSDGNPLTVNRPMVFESHTPAVDTYRSTLVFDFVGNVAYVYDATGNYKQWSLS